MAPKPGSPPRVLTRRAFVSASAVASVIALSPTGFSYAASLSQPSFTGERQRLLHALTEAIAGVPVLEIGDDASRAVDSVVGYYSEMNDAGRRDVDMAVDAVAGERGPARFIAAPVAERLAACRAGLLDNSLFRGTEASRAQLVRLATRLATAPWTPERSGVDDVVITALLTDAVAR